jgi:acyl-CoA reductase-like NAD-dependent aldehyde dehydrogenase
VPRQSGAGHGCKILDQEGIKPHKVRYYLERRDPDFAEKMAEVLWVYRRVKVLKAATAALSALGPGERRAKLIRTADVLETRVEDFIATMAAETGATAGRAKHNVRLAANMLREAAAMTAHITGEVIPSDERTLALAVRQPAGVFLGIAPWNGPVILGVRAIAMALACGNTVILKTSEICPPTHRLIGEVMLEAGLAPGVVNIVTNAPADAAKIVDALISHPAVRRVNFTGSTRVGRIIGETAARHLKPALLELGGKAPFLVLDDADLDEAVKAAAFGGFVNQGQTCVSTERIVVDVSIADTFVAKLRQKVTTMPAGDPRRGDFVLGSIVSRETVERIDSLVDDAVGKGTKLVAGGRTDGTIMEATVLDHVTSAMQIYGEETFGLLCASSALAGWTRRSGSQTTRTMGYPPPFMAATSPALWRWLSGLNPACVTSTARASKTSHRCLSVV